MVSSWSCHCHSAETLVECGQGEAKVEELTPPPVDQGDLQPRPEDGQLDDGGRGGVNVGRHRQEVRQGDVLLDPGGPRHQSVQREEEDRDEEGGHEAPAPSSLVLGQEVEAEQEVGHCIREQEEEQESQQTGHFLRILSEFEMY